MAVYTKFYLLQAGTLVPNMGNTSWPAGGWHRTGNFTVMIDGAKFGSGARAATRNETSATTPYDLGVIRGVSRKLLPQTISGTVDLVLGVSESSTGADFYSRLHLYVYNATDDAVLGTLVSAAESAAGDVEWTTTNTGTAFTAPVALSALAIPDDGKEYYLVAELGPRAYNSSTGSVTASMRFGAVDGALAPLADLTVGSTSTSTLAGFLQFSNGITVEAATAGSDFVAGTMMIPGADDSLNGGPEVAVILSTLDGTTVGSWPELPTAETGDNLPSGAFAISAQAQPGFGPVAIRIYDGDKAFVADIPVATLAAGTWGAFSPIRSDQNDTFYVMQIAAASPTTLHAIASDGTVIDSWTMPSSAGRGCAAMAPARDGSKVYFGFRTSDESCNGIGVFDLAGAGSELTALVPTAAGKVFGRDLLVTADGDILVSHQQPSPSFEWDIERYNPDGTLAATYALPVDSADFDKIELSQNPLDPDTFWARTYPADGVSRWIQFDIASGDELNAYDVTLKNGAGDQTLVPLSCPFIIFPQSTDQPEVIGPLAWVHWPRVQP